MNDECSGATPTSATERPLYHRLMDAAEGRGVANLSEARNLIREAMGALIRQTKGSTMSLDYTYVFWWSPNDDWRGNAAPTAATLLDGMVERGEIPSGKALVSENRIMVWRCDKHGLSPEHWIGLRPTQVLASNELDPFEIIWPTP